MPESFGRAVEVAFRLEEGAMVDAQGGVVGVGRHRRLVMRQRFGAQAGVVQGQSELQVAHRKIRAQRQGFAVAGDRRQIVALTEERVAEVVARRRAARAPDGAFRQQCFGPAEVAVVDQTRAEVVVVMGGARIPGQRFFHQPDALVGAA